MCVHTSHCCVLHGCKYSRGDCPVVLRRARQEHLCEDCEDDGLAGIPDPDDPDYDLLTMTEEQLRGLCRELRAALRSRGRPRQEQGE